MARKLPEIISEEEFLEILKVTKKSHHKIAFILGFYAAMRISEIVNLTPDNVDKGQKLIRIKQGKGKKDRNIPLPPQALRGLKHLPIKCGVRALQFALHKASLKALGRRIKYHTLRHSGATYYLTKKKWDVRFIQRLLGHSKLDTTAIYTHIQPDDLINKMWEDVKL